MTKTIPLDLPEDFPHGTCMRHCYVKLLANRELVATGQSSQPITPSGRLALYQVLARGQGISKK